MNMKRLFGSTAAVLLLFLKNSKSNIHVSNNYKKNLNALNDVSYTTTLSQPFPWGRL
jgi:hypothetical protein